MAKYYGMIWSYNDLSCLSHHGIKGQRWGVRRFQNEDGTLTDEGRKRYGYTLEEIDKKLTDAKKKAKALRLRSDDLNSRTGLKAVFTTNDIKNSRAKKKAVKAEKEVAEIESVYDNLKKHDDQMKIAKVQQPLRDQLKLSSSALTKKDRALFSKVKNGEDLSPKEKTALKDAWKKYLDENFKLGEQYTDILKKYGAYSDNNPVPPDAQKKIDDIATKIAENRKALAEAEYAKTLNEEHEYAKSIGERVNNQTNKIPVDPAYRQFDSKEAKAKAEAEYLSCVWQTDMNSITDQAESDRMSQEILHLAHKISDLSMDGYSGIPKSERNQAMYDYEPTSDYDRFNSFDTYDNWQPKYQKTKEWRTLEQQKEKIINESDYKRLSDEYHNAVLNGLSEKETVKLYKAMSKAYDERRQQLDKIEKELRRIEEPFYTQIAKNALLDIGYEVTSENIDLIMQLIWYD